MFDTDPLLVFTAWSCAEPGDAIWALEMETKSALLLTICVGQFLLFQRKTVSVLKFDPLTLRMKLGPPADTAAGLMEEIAGVFVLV